VKPTDAVEDYLKTIYSIDESGQEITTTAIAQRLGVSPASVTAMLKRLSAMGYIDYHRYHGVDLTDRGKALALEVVRHHRLLEAYLHQTLGMPWDKVHDEAEVLEHAISEELEDRIARFLGNPTHDPHGDPIPPKFGEYREEHHDPLDSVVAGPARVERVSDRDPDALRYMASIGLQPGTKIVVERKDPFGGPVWVKVGKRRRAIGTELAHNVFVSRVTQ
jgi:DtxR family transcriptional regulator, Mn-dependent transcriptional regulator